MKNWELIEMRRHNDTFLKDEPEYYGEISQHAQGQRVRVCLRDHKLNGRLGTIIGFRESEAQVLVKCVNYPPCYFGVEAVRKIK